MADDQVTIPQLQSILSAALDSPYVDIEDISGGCGTAFNAIVVSSQFTKKTSLARNRLVNAAIKEQMPNIHAWSCRCVTPEDWEKQGKPNVSGEVNME